MNEPQTYYELFQIQRYGSALPACPAEDENGSLSTTRAAEWCDEQGELRLMEDAL